MEIISLILRLKRCLNYIVMYNMLILIVIFPELLFCLNVFNLLNFELGMQKTMFFELNYI